MRWKSKKALISFIIVPNIKPKFINKVYYRSVKFHLENILRRVL